MAFPDGLVWWAPNDDWNVESPTWARLDSTYKVSDIVVKRGRFFETERMDTGTCEISLIDTTGAFDPTNTGGTYYSSILPRKQVAVCLPNAAGSSYSTIFRGYTSRWRCEPDATQDFFRITIECVDGMDILANMELQPDMSFSTASVVAGNIVYPEDAALTAVQTRIKAVLDDFGWPGTGTSDTLRDLFTGNVGLQRTVYAPRTTALSVIQDAADAEFPGGVAYFLMSKDGQARFRGRFARFHPDDTDYGIDTWNLGDFTSAAASPTTTVPVSPPLVFYKDDALLYNEALATPQGIADGDIAGQVVSDATSIGDYGRRTWSAENLLTLGGVTGTTALEETALMAQYVVDNFKNPKVRCEALTIRPQAPTGVYGTATWNLLRGIEISDIVHLSTSFNGGGGFDADFYVEGLAYHIAPMTATHPEVTLTIDVSNKGFYDSNPFNEPA